MKPGNAIEVRDVTKKFKIYLDKGHTLKEKTLFQKRRKYEERSVLAGISFEVKKGEAVGLIGHNGCGKSTTLKLLTKIMYPDSGSIQMSGRVSSLLELGAGFHPDMSGRENIYINASIFGLTKKEIDQRMGEIISFSELEEFIDHPVRTYSSGMYMRLAFSVAINVNADILLIDEILAVGDAMFQSKCFNRLREIKANGKTIVIVSHSTGQLEQICDRNLWIDHGKIRKEGPAREIGLLYLDYMMQREREKSEKKAENDRQYMPENKAVEENTGNEKIEKENRSIEIEKETKEQKKKELGNHQIEIIDVGILNGPIFKIGDDVELCIRYQRNDKALQKAVLGINIIRNDGTYCYGTSTQIDGCKAWELKDEGIIKVRLKKVYLLHGIYHMDIAFDDGNAFNYHYIYKAVQFQIQNEIEELGIVRIGHEWVFDMDVIHG